MMSWTNAGGGGRGVNRSLVPTTRPLQHNLVRLCVNPIDPIHDISMRVSFNWIWDGDANDDDIDNANAFGVWMLRPWRR